MQCFFQHAYLLFGRKFYRNFRKTSQVFGLVTVELHNKLASLVYNLLQQISSKFKCEFRSLVHPILGKFFENLEREWKL